MRRPVVVVPSCTKEIGLFTFDAVGRIYCEAIAMISQCQPLLAPVGPGTTEISALLDAADGILLTGSYTNVHPSRYGTEAPVKPDLLDPERDSMTLSLIEAAFAKRTPIFAICRGFQELNVALGGTLHQAIHTIPGYLDHRESQDRGLDAMFEPAHPVSLRGGLSEWVGKAEIWVNSLHGQGIAQLANPLVAEATAPDGLIEAIRGRDGERFCFGVQWHPEWEPHRDDVSLSLFRHFGAAAGAMVS